MQRHFIHTFKPKQSIVKPTHNPDRGKADTYGLMRLRGGGTVTVKEKHRVKKRTSDQQALESILLTTEARWRI